MELVSEVFLQNFADDLEGPSFVVAFQILHVLEQECAWSVSLQDPCNIEEQRSLSFVKEPMFPAQRILF